MQSARSFARPYLCAALVTSVLLTACASKPAPEPAPPPPTPVAQPAPPPPPEPTPVGETDAQKLARITKMLSDNSIYFDYNTYTIKADGQSTLQADSDALKSMPSIKLSLEGNADERGSAEYNLALGQKRSEAVKQALKEMGIPEDSLEAVSFGKEKPRATCHDESCWSQNRRVDLKVK
jgi:peptidoglycan-associated lipoprotein